MRELSSILTVTSAAADYDLTTLAAVKAELDITNGASDALLERYITSASKAAMAYCDRVFNVETVSERFLSNNRFQQTRFRDGPPLQLQRWPLITVTSVTEADTLLVVETDYVVNTSNGQLIRMSGDAVANWSAFETTVVYSCGFTVIPADVEDAVIRMVTNRYSAKGRDHSLRQESIPGVREATYWIATGEEAGNITPDVADLLNAYRVRQVA